MKFKFANTQEVRKVYFDAEDPESEWIEVQAEFNKKDVRHLMKIAPRAANKDGQVEIDQVIDWQEQLFELVVKGWSFVDEHGDMIPCTRENYSRLDTEGIRWIDKQIEEAITPILKIGEDDEKKPSN